MAAEDYIDECDAWEPSDDPSDYNPYFDKVPYKACPKCGGDLVLRTNKKTNQQFMGCANFPECDFTCSPYDAEVKNVFGGYTNDRYPGTEIIEIEDFNARVCPFCGEPMSVRPFGSEVTEFREWYLFGCLNEHCFAPQFKVGMFRDRIEDMEYPKDLRLWNRSTARIAPVRYMLLKAHRGTNAFTVSEDYFNVFKKFVKHLNSIPVKD